jgi:uncharacterized membrane protein (UPF0127 family)
MNACNKSAFIGVYRRFRGFSYVFRHALLLLAALALAVSAARAQMPEIPLTINGHKLTVEVAGTNETRMQGLMHRRILPENRGMLFVFREVTLHAMWMMNTYIPLSVAFLDERGVIINIEDMKPHTQDTHPAAKPAQYALEMNQGWFSKRGIKPGARIEGLDRAPPAR